MVKIGVWLVICNLSTPQNDTRKDLKLQIACRNPIFSHFSLPRRESLKFSYGLSANLKRSIGSVFFVVFSFLYMLVPFSSNAEVAQSAFEPSLIERLVIDSALIQPKLFFSFNALAVKSAQSHYTDQLSSTTTGDKVNLPATSEMIQNGESGEIILPSYLEKPVHIGVTMILNEVTKINEALGFFEGSIDLKLTWHDPSLVFDAKKYGTFRRELCLEYATAKLAKIWNPEIIIQNMNDKPIRQKQCLLIDADGTVTYIERVKGNFESKLNLTAFPFDTQLLKIFLISNRYNNTQVDFIQTQEEINHSGIREGTALPGWFFEKIEFDYPSIRGLDGTFFQIFEASIVIDRDPWSHLFAFAPLLLIVVVPTIVTLYVQAEVGTRLGNWSGAILALIAMSFTLNLRYPALGSDSILSQLIAIIFGYEFLMICVSMSILNPAIANKLKNPYIVPEFTEYFLRWSVPLIFVILVVARILLTMLA